MNCLPELWKLVWHASDSMPPTPGTGGVNPTPEPTAFPPLVVHVVTTPNPLPTERAFVPNAGTLNGDNGDVNIFDAKPGFALGNLVQDFQNLARPLDVAFNATGSTVYIVESAPAATSTRYRRRPHRTSSISTNMPRLRHSERASGSRDQTFT